MTSAVQDGQDHDLAVVDVEIDSVRELLDDSPTYFAVNRWKSGRIRGDSLDRLFDCGCEPSTETGLLFLVPLQSIAGLCSGLRPKDDRMRHVLPRRFRFTSSHGIADPGSAR